MVPRLESPATPEHLAYHLNSWHAEGHSWTFVDEDNFKWWLDFHDRIKHPDGAEFQMHTHTDQHR